MTRPIEPKRKDFKNEERYQDAFDKYLFQLEKYRQYIEKLNKESSTKAKYDGVM